MGLKRAVAHGCAKSGEHSLLKPQTPRVKREPLLRIREQDVSMIVQLCINMRQNLNLGLYF